MPTADGKVVITVDSNARQSATDFNTLDQSLKNVEKDGQQVAAGSNKMFGALGSLKGAVVAAGVAFAGMKLAQFAGDIFKISSQFEQLNVAFGVLAGQTAGQQLVKDLTDLANVTPMTTQGLADNARLLLSFGEASQNIIPDLKLLGDISGGNQQKMDMLALAFAQAGASGRLMGQDLLQMVNAGFNPLQQISEKTGKSMGELKKEMEAGRISFSMIKQAMVDATSEGGRFYGMMNKQSQTLEGRLSTLADKWSLVAKNIGDFFLPAAKAAVDWFIKVGDSVLRLQQTLAGLDHPIQRAYVGLQKFFGILPKESGLVFTMKTDIPQKASQVSNAMSKMNAGFRDSSVESEKHAKKTKQQATEYDKLMQKVNQLQDKLRIMSIRGQENTQAFAQGKEQLAKYTAQIEKANKAIEITAQLNPFEKLNKDLQQATLEMQNLAASDVVDINKFNAAKQKATELTMELQKVNEMTKIDTSSLGSYDALNKKIDELRTNLQNMAVAGQAGTPVFDKMKNDYIEATNQMKQANRQVTNSMGIDWSNVGDSIRQDLASAITTPLREGETAFQRLGNVALNIISMVGQKMVEQLLEEISLTQVLNGVKAIGKALSFGLFANGDVFSGGKPQAFANGGVVSSPTLFPMKNGAGLMGEAGAEAIMPLKRTSNGRLGVEATGQTSPQINIYNQSQSQIETVTRPNGETDLFIRKVNNALASERTQSGFTRASSRQNSRGITAA